MTLQQLSNMNLAYALFVVGLLVYAVVFSTGNVQLTSLHVKH